MDETTHGRVVVSTTGTEPVIHLTRLNGPAFVLNPDLLQKAEATPDTVVTLVDGTKYVIAESIETLAERVLTHRASVVALARHLTDVSTAVEDDVENDAVLAQTVPFRPRRRI